MILLTPLLQLQAQPFKMAIYEAQEELDAVQDQKLITGKTSLFMLPQVVNKPAGQQQIVLSDMTSNYDGAFFKKESIRITLSEPISEELSNFASKVKPSAFVLRPLDKNGEEVFEIVGYTKRIYGFTPQAHLFPEFADLNLVNFDKKRNRLRTRFGKWVLTSFNSSWVTAKPNDSIPLNDCRLSFGKRRDRHQEQFSIQLGEPVTKTINEWQMVYRIPGALLKKIPGSNKYRLVGFTHNPFLLH